MIKQNLELVEQSFDDLRFGLVNIYKQRNTSNLIMEKIQQCKSLEEFEELKKSTLQRMQMNNPNLLFMVDFEFLEQNLEVKQFYSYPNEDLFERKQELQNPREFMKLFKEGLQALVALEKFSVVHGNIKPEYIYYDGEKYVLLDRLADNSTPNEAQIDNLKSNEFIYLPPNVFEQLCANNTYYKHNYFKTDLFCFGMVIISQLLQEEEQLQNIYSKENSVFEKDIFKRIISQLKRNLFSDGDLKKIGDLLFYGILNPDSKQRFTPRKALVILQNIEQTFDSQLKKEDSLTKITKHENQIVEQNTVIHTKNQGQNKMQLLVNKQGQEKITLDLEDQDYEVNEEEEINMSDDQIHKREVQKAQLKFNKLKSEEKFEVDFSDKDQKSLNSFGSQKNKEYFKQVSMNNDEGNLRGEFEYEERDNQVGLDQLMNQTLGREKNIFSGHLEKIPFSYEENDQECSSPQKAKSKIKDSNVFQNEDSQSQLTQSLQQSNYSQFKDGNKFQVNQSFAQNNQESGLNVQEEGQEQADFSNFNTFKPSPQAQKIESQGVIVNPKEQFDQKLQSCFAANQLKIPNYQQNKMPSLVKQDTLENNQSQGERKVSDDDDICSPQNTKQYEEFGLDFLKNDDASQRREFFDDPVSHLDVAYSEITQVLQPSRNQNLSITDNISKNLSFDENSVSDVSPIKNNKRRFTYINPNINQSEQVDSEDLPSEIKSLLLENKDKYSISQNKTKLDNKKVQKSLDESAKDLNMDFSQSPHYYNDFEVEDFNQLKKDKNNQTTQNSEKIISPLQMQMEDDDVAHQKNYDKRKTNSMKDSQNFNHLKDGQDHQRQLEIQQKNQMKDDMDLSGLKNYDYGLLSETCIKQEDNENDNSLSIRDSKIDEKRKTFEEVGPEGNRKVIEEMNPDNQNQAKVEENLVAQNSLQEIQESWNPNIIRDSETIENQQRSQNQTVNQMAQNAQQQINLAFEDRDDAQRRNTTRSRSVKKISLRDIGNKPFEDVSKIQTVYLHDQDNGSPTQRAKSINSNQQSHFQEEDNRQKLQKQWHFYDEPRDVQDEQLKIDYNASQKDKMIEPDQINIENLTENKETLDTTQGGDPVEKQQINENSPHDENLFDPDQLNGENPERNQDMLNIRPSDKLNERPQVDQNTPEEDEIDPDLLNGGNPDQHKDLVNDEPHAGPDEKPQDDQNQTQEDQIDPDFVYRGNPDQHKDLVNDDPHVGPDEKPQDDQNQPEEDEPIDPDMMDPENPELNSGGDIKGDPIQDPISEDPALHQIPFDKEKQSNPQYPGTNQTPSDERKVKNPLYPGTAQTPFDQGKVGNPQFPESPQTPNNLVIQTTPQYPGSLQTPSHKGEKINPQFPDQDQTPFDKNNSGTPQYPGMNQTPFEKNNQGFHQFPGLDQTPYDKNNSGTSKYPGTNQTPFDKNNYRTPQYPGTNQTPQYLGTNQTLQYSGTNQSPQYPRTNQTPSDKNHSQTPRYPGSNQAPFDKNKLGNIYNPGVYQAPLDKSKQGIAQNPVLSQRPFQVNREGVDSKILGKNHSNYIIDPQQKIENSNIKEVILKTESDQLPKNLKLETDQDVLKQLFLQQQLNRNGNKIQNTPGVSREKVTQIKRPSSYRINLGNVRETGDFSFTSKEPIRMNHLDMSFDQGQKLNTKQPRNSNNTSSPLSQQSVPHTNYVYAQPTFPETQNPYIQTQYPARPSLGNFQNPSYNPFPATNPEFLRGIPSISPNQPFSDNQEIQPSNDFNNPSGRGDRSPNQQHPVSQKQNQTQTVQRRSSFGPGQQIYRPQVVMNSGQYENKQDFDKRQDPGVYIINNTIRTENKQSQQNPGTQPVNPNQPQSQFYLRKTAQNFENQEQESHFDKRYDPGVYIIKKTIRTENVQSQQNPGLQQVDPNSSQNSLFLKKTAQNFENQEQESHFEQRYKPGVLFINNTIKIYNTNMIPQSQENSRAQPTNVIVQPGNVYYQQKSPSNSLKVDQNILLSTNIKSNTVHTCFKSQLRKKNTSFKLPYSGYLVNYKYINSDQLPLRRHITLNFRYIFKKINIQNRITLWRTILWQQKTFMTNVRYEAKFIDMNPHQNHFVRDESNFSEFLLYPNQSQQNQRVQISQSYQTPEASHYPQQVQVRKVYQPLETVTMLSHQPRQSNLVLYNDYKLQNSLTQSQLKRKMQQTSYTKSWLNNNGEREKTTPLPEKHILIHDQNLIYLKNENGMQIYKYKTQIN